MKLSPILLELLGSFYQQPGKSKLVSDLDKIYSRIILERYVDVIRDKLLSEDKTLVALPRYGVVKWEDYNPSDGSIRISTPRGEYVEMSTVRYITVPYIGGEKFFSVVDGVVGDGFTDLLAELDSQFYSVIYMVKGTNSSFNLAGMDYIDNIEEGLDRLISRDAIDMIINLSMYEYSTREIVTQIVNILAGAAYYSGSAIVIDINGRTVELSTGTIIEVPADGGEILVEVGDELSGLTLLNQLLEVDTSGEFLPEIKNLSIAMNTFSSSPSNVTYLAKLSKTLMKKKHAIVVPLEVFTEIGKEGVALISSISSYAIGSSYVAMTNIASADEVYLDGASKFIIPSTSDIHIVEESSIIVNFTDNSTMTMYEEGILKLVEEETANVDSELGINMMPLEFIDNYTMIEEELFKIQDEAEVRYSETIKSYGDHTTHTIAHVSGDERLLISEEGIGNISDNNVDGAEGFVEFEDTIRPIEHIFMTMVTHDMVSLIMSEKREFLLRHSDSQAFSEQGDVTTIISSSDIATMSSVFSLGTGTQTIVSYADSHGFKIDTSSRFTIIETGQSTGTKDTVHESISISESASAVIQIKEIVFGVDESTIDTSTEIDEE